MTSGRSLTRICLGYRHWVQWRQRFGGRVLNSPQQFMGYAVEFRLRKDAMQSLKASRSRKHGGNSGNNPRLTTGCIRAAATFNCESESFTPCGERERLDGREDRPSSWPLGKVKWRR